MTDGSPDDQADPGWVEALADSLHTIAHHPDDTRLPLPIEVALADVCAVFDRPLTPHRRTCDLLLDELRTALNAQPKALPVALHDGKGRLIQSVSELISRPQLTLSDTTARGNALAALRAALSELSAPAALSMRWEEVVGVFRSGRSTFAKRLRMIDRFRCVWLLAGRDWPFVAGRLAGVLRNDAFQIELASNRSAADNPFDPSKFLGQRAELSIEQRLEYCRRILEDTGRSGDCVVWLLFSNARTGQAESLAVGDVEFFDGPWIGSLLAHHPTDPRLPRELVQNYWVQPAELDGDIVAARVLLRDHAVESAVETATALALSLVRYASLYSAWVWELQPTHSLYVDGRFAGSASSGDDRVAYSHEAKFAVAEQLAVLRPDVKTNLLSGSAQVVQIVELLGPLKDIINGSADFRVLMVPRLLERVATIAEATDWPSLLKSDIGGIWAVKQFRRFLVETAYESLHEDLIDRGGIVDREGLVGQIQQLRLPGGRFDIAAFTATIKEIIPLFRVASTRWLRLRDASRVTASGPTAVEEISRYATVFSARVSRLERCRNSLVHGWPVAQDVLETLQTFSVGIAVDAVHFGLQGALTQASAKAGFDSARGDATKTIDSLNSAIDVGEIGQILFPRETR